jgi:hypothetical protein
MPGFPRLEHFRPDRSGRKHSISLFDRMIHTLRTFPSRFVSLADANETLAAQRDHALTAAPGGRLASARIDNQPEFPQIGGIMEDEWWQRLTSRTCRTTFTRS